MKKKHKELLIRSIVAAAMIAVMLIALVVGLKNCPSESPKPHTQSEQNPEPQWEGKRIPGIDVSAHQGKIDWQAVADSGVKFAMVRLGYRGYETGLLHVDKYARENLEGAKAAGLQVGAYFFSQALNEQEAREEAALALEVLDGFQLDLPLTYDWEYVAEDKRTGDMDGDTLLTCIDAFCDAVSEHYEPMIYFNQELSRTLLDLEQVEEYPFWLAKYTKELSVDYPVRMWQYSDSGTVPGIEEKVDLDWYYPEVEKG